MNVVEVHIKVKDDEARAGLKATEEEAKSSGERAGKGFSARFKSAMGGIGNSLKGGGLFAALSGGLSMASPLAGAGLAVGAFAAVAVPELSKVQAAMSQTGKAGQKAMSQLSGPEKELVPALRGVSTAFGQVKAALAPVVDKVISLGAKLLTDLMPALKIMATAGGKVIEEFLKPFDALVKSSVFDKFIKVMAQGAVQIGSVLGPSLVNLIKSLMVLFIQVMPSGVKILSALLPLFAQIVTDITPTVTVLSKLLAVSLQWLAANHLLIPVLGILGAALIAVVVSVEAATAPWWLWIAAIVAVVAAIVEFAKHWKQIWAEVKRVFDDVINFIKAHWRGIVEILTGPVGFAIVWIVDHFNQITGVVGRVVGSIGRGFSGVYHAIVDPVWHAVQDVFGFFNQIINFAASIPSKVGHFLGSVVSAINPFEHGGIVGAAATGGARSGLTMVGEHGRELVSLPGGSKVHSNPDTERMMGQGGKGQPTIISFDFGGAGTDELIKLLRGAIRVKGGNVQTVLGH